MAKRDVTVWMDEHVYCVLSECLPEGTSIEQELARMLLNVGLERLDPSL